MNRLQQIEQAWSKATEGPYALDEWIVRGGDAKPLAHIVGLMVYFRSPEQDAANGALLALSWEAVRDLLAVAKAAVALDSCPGAGSLELHEALAPLLAKVAG